MNRKSVQKEKKTDPNSGVVLGNLVVMRFLCSSYIDQSFLNECFLRLLNMNMFLLCLFRLYVPTIKLCTVYLPCWDISSFCQVTVLRSQEVTVTRFPERVRAVCAWKDMGYEKRKKACKTGERRNSLAFLDTRGEKLDMPKRLR
jgi:hypothetical protein